MSQSAWIPGPTTGAHHQRHPGKLSVLQASCPSGWMPIQGMSEHRPSMAISVVLALGPTQGNVVHAWCKSLLVIRPDCPLLRLSVPLPVCALVLFGLHCPEMMEPIRVKDTAALEVKFLDRCQVHSSEGVLPACVRRSRMRVWGAKMIRHRRSPATVNCASQASAGQPFN